MIHAGRAHPLSGAGQASFLSSIICVPDAQPDRFPAVTPAEIKTLIQEALPASEVEVTGEDGAHFEARVVSTAFEGKRAVARHQMVYAALGGRMGREIHALSLRTLTPDEARGA